MAQSTALPAASPVVAASNAEVAAVFDEIADWLELDGANPFRVRAYRNAARTIGGWPQPLDTWRDADHPLADLPGIGDDLAGKIEEILAAGSCALLRELRHTHPRGLTALLRLPGLGPRRALRLHEELGVSSVRGLLRAARAGRIRTLKGFGKDTERHLLEAAVQSLGTTPRWKLSAALPQAEALAAFLQAAPEPAQVVLAGSLRRWRETVGDIDLLVATRHRRALSERFLAYPLVQHVLAQGETRSSVVLRSGLQVDLRVVRPASLGAALVYFTGSKAHNLALRARARKRGLKINEYGVYRGSRRLAGDTEASVYAAVDLPVIEPELREDAGEIEAAAAVTLPALITPGDLRGDLHSHTNASDGGADLETMARAAAAAGLEYLAITDHSRGLAVTGGLDRRRLLAQIEAIDRFNDTHAAPVLLKGIEVDILEDGRLDLPDALLARLDLVVAAVHSHFDLSRERQTARLLRAMDHRCFSILAHPTGRLIEQRAAYAVDMERVVRHARDRGCFLEANAHPDRLDLNDAHCRLAKAAGVPLAIGSDAHDASGFAALRFGIGQARRGWIEAKDVVNTLPLAALRARLAATMGG
ncbi:MAG TPA: DNA polymerase/3'-5' exonuclease PolX [Frateuria sp.]|uniref:DNA polymerase/3'-5' exonuclease PolX n=1 Tax=Frateuria sp. TaxID=2211372 RepID=UPI002D7F62FB|nr:DNA polymerase/3'-5' exonuclease PolX [Frateuria sp.]HET6805497.1 DNA polymerase/3'-5' exonuclease PolX [Frateuria sp.]